MSFNSEEFFQILYITKEILYLNLCLWIVPVLGFFAKIHLDFSNFYLSVLLLTFWLFCVYAFIFTLLYPISPV